MFRYSPEKLCASTALFALFAGGCAVRGSSDDSKDFCSEGVTVGEDITASLRASLQRHGMNPVDMDGVVDTAYAANTELAKLRHNTTSTVYPGDSFGYCVSGSDVSLGSKSTLVLEAPVIG